MSGAASYHEEVRMAKRAIIESALLLSAGHVTRAAAALGLQRSYLHRLIRTLNVARPVTR